MNFGENKVQDGHLHFPFQWQIFVNFQQFTSKSDPELLDGVWERKDLPILIRVQNSKFLTPGMNFLSFEIDEEFEEYQQTWYFLQISLIRKQPDKDIIKRVSNISFKTELEQYENMIQLLDDTQGCMIST